MCETKGSVQYIHTDLPGFFPPAINLANDKTDISQNIRYFQYEFAQIQKDHPSSIKMGFLNLNSAKCKL